VARSNTSNNRVTDFILSMAFSVHTQFRFPESPGTAPIQIESALSAPTTFQ